MKNFLSEYAQLIHRVKKDDKIQRVNDRRRAANSAATRMTHFEQVNDILESNPIVGTGNIDETSGELELLGLVVN